MSTCERNGQAHFASVRWFAGWTRRGEV